MNTSNDEHDLLERERQRGMALVARNAAALDALFPDDMVHIHSTGLQMDKPQLLHYVLEVLRFLSVEREALRVQLYGDIAVMTGRMRTRMQPAGRPEPVSAESLVTQVWRRTPQGWQQSHFHGCRMADAPPATAKRD